MNKKNWLVLLATLVLFAVSLTSAEAKDNKDNDWRKIVPQADGVYDVPGHPDLQVQVFVHKNTKPVLATACGLDPDSSAMVSRAKWRLPAGAWKYNLYPASVPVSANMTASDVAAAVELSLGVWSGAINNRVTFSRQSDLAGATAVAAYDNKNIIGWGSVSATNAIAITYIVYTRSGLALDLDTIMNSALPWSWWQSGQGCPTGAAYDAQNIFTHEFGHWLGLNDEYSANRFRNATMYGYGSTNETKKNTLSTGDIRGLKAIYGIQ